jgi:hypothetical protein
VNTIGNEGLATTRYLFVPFFAAEAQIIGNPNDKIMHRPCSLGAVLQHWEHQGVVWWDWHLMPFVHQWWPAEAEPAT